MNQAIFLPKRKGSSWWASAGGKTGICIPLEIGIRNQNFPKNLTSVAQFQLIDLFLAVTLYLQLWHSHCTRQQGNCNTPGNFKSFFRCKVQQQVTIISSPKIVQHHVTIILPHENISCLRPCAWMNGLFKINAYSGFFSRSIKLHRGLVSMQACGNTS